MKNNSVLTFIGVVLLAFMFSLPAQAMNKQDLVRHMADKAGISKSNATKVLNSVTKRITEALKKGDKVTLIKFGAFSVSKRAARTGRDPQTGKPITIPAQKEVRFKAGSDLIKLVENAPVSSPPPTSSTPPTQEATPTPPSTKPPSAKPTPWSKRKWTRMPGRANDIAIGAKGHVWIIGTNKEGGGFGIYRFSFKQTKWNKVPGSAVRIAVGPRGNAWVVNKQGNIFRFTGKKWAKMPGKAHDIGIGARGHVWITGGKKEKGGYGIYLWNGKTKKWGKTPGSAVRISVGPKGNAWVVNNQGRIFRFAGRKWIRYPGKARDIGIGARGHAWVVGTNKMPGGFGVFRWNGKTWKQVRGGLTGIAVGPRGNPWGVNAAKHIFWLR